MNMRRLPAMLLMILGFGPGSLLVHAGDAPFSAEGCQFEAAGKWEEAYQAYVQSIDNKEPVSTNEAQRAISHAFIIATERLGRFDEAIALTDRYLKENKDGHLRHLLGCFYRDKLHDYDKAREQFRLSYEDYMAQGDRLFEALRNLHAQAMCYQTQLWEMDYYPNRKYRESYTRKAHHILLEGLPLIDQLGDRQKYYEMRWEYLWSLRDIYRTSWYSGKNPELAAEYDQLLIIRETGGKSAYQQACEQYQFYSHDKRWADAAQVWDDYMGLHPGVTNDLAYMQMLSSCYYWAKNWENTARVAAMTMDLMDRTLNAKKTDIEKAVAGERSWIGTYEEAISSAIKLKRYEQAFEVMERSLARAMLDLIGGRDYSKRQERISADDRELLLLKSRIDEIKDAIENERKNDRPEEMASLQRSLVVAEDASHKIQRRVDIARREIMSSARVEPLTTKQVQDMIGDDTLVMVWYGLYMSVVTKDKVTSRWIRGSSYFDKLIRDFREAIDVQGRQARSLALEDDGEVRSNAAAAAAADAKILAIGQEMYRIIFKPMEKDFSRNSDRVYVVADRDHPLIPYQVLHDGERYLAEKYTLVYAPSMSVLKKCMERRHPAGQKLLALGNPDLGNPDFNLVYAEDEVKKLAEIYPDARILTGAEASEAAVQLLAPDADILHLACHGVIDEDDPMKSHLRLAPDKDNDGFLTADEIMDLNLPCSLVTLSACDTGRGRILMGGDILGLTRAWIYAGAPSVLASLWKVDDRATSRLMTAFYENLKTHDKAKALQLAQIDMIKEGLGPFYWAAFCLYGDYQ